VVSVLRGRQREELSAERRIVALQLYETAA
jgi:hypothetical protein